MNLPKFARSNTISIDPLTSFSKTDYSLSVRIDPFQKLISIED